MHARKDNCPTPFLKYNSEAQGSRLFHASLHRFSNKRSPRFSGWGSELDRLSPQEILRLPGLRQPKELTDRSTHRLPTISLINDENT